MKSTDTVSKTIEERNKKYLKYVEEKSPKASWGKPLFHAFLIGGLICCLGQLIGDVFRAFFPLMDNKMVAGWINIVIITATSLLTGFGIFDKIARYAGAGTVIPITGFANSVASSAMEFKREGLVFGLGAKMFYVAGPVLVNGVTFSILVGIIYFFISLF